jgi:hypothetical protein
MPSSGASWRTRRRLLAAPLDKEEPRTSLPRTRVNKGKRKRLRYILSTQLLPKDS